MKNVTLDLNSGTYSLAIACGLLDDVASLLKKESFGNKYVIISDVTVAKLYGKKLETSMNNVGLDVSLVTFASGEEHKHLKTYSTLQEQLFELGCDRKACIVALGGGVVGDVAGFVAATYMRGINFVQIPTTLLAMVDASIGGKTGVDLVSGKNLVGAFHQPQAVFIDPSLLESLPLAEIRNGLSECIKHGCISDVDLLGFIESNLDQILSKKTAVLEELIFRNCSIKANVVMQDEKESGIRKMLNYGHTLGHALEAAIGYGVISHGAAVALGMVAAAKLSVVVGRLSQQECDRLITLLERVGFEVTLLDVSIDKLVSLMKRDKKMVDGALQFVLLEKLGKAVLDVDITDSAIVSVLEGMM
ncbi:MAG: 3-dehydroquinate synthase [Nanoarchaeota archaeon]|nr:3-dehydroquinate synthase [Nanoarchaeota archaeon]